MDSLQDRCSLACTNRSQPHRVQSKGERAYFCFLIFLLAETVSSFTLVCFDVKQKWFSTALESHKLMDSTAKQYEYGLKTIKE